MKKAWILIAVWIALSAALVFLFYLRRGNPGEEGVHTPELDRGLIGYWPFDETRGRVIHDHSGSGRDGSILGPEEDFAWARGRVGRGCLQLNGGQALNVDLGTRSFGPLEGVTVAFWLRTTSRLPRRIFSNPSLEIDAAGTLTVGYANVKQWVRPVADGQWHHVAFCVDRFGQISCSLDGEVRTEARSTDRTVVAWDNWTWTIAPPPAGFDGSLDDFRIYNRVLSEAEIKQLAELK
ncbi:MAG: LamG domain-containing protein [Planctomycetes bacterium]|nr:LamG domain-containing protein [Planctomycetota bacterium]